MKTIVYFSALFFSFFWALAPNAAMYYWVDENGVKNFSSDPPPKGVTYKTVGEDSTPEPDPDEKVQAEKTEALDALLKDVKETDKKNEDEAEALKRQAETQSGADKPLNREEITRSERKKLEDMLEHLKKLPPESFANSRSRNVIIGQYQYKLSQLNSSPAKYFGWQE